MPGADALVDAWAPAERQPRVRPLAATAVLLYVTVGLFIAAMGAYPAFREKLLATIPFERESPALDIPEGAGRTAAQPEAPDGQDKSTVVERDAPPTQVVPASSNASTASSLEARLDERADVPASLPVTAADMAALRRDHALDPSGAFAGGRFSPDGRLVAFADDRGGEARGIYIAHRDGSDTMRVSGAGRAAAQRWSPDNGRLAFVRTEPERPAVWNLWVYRVRTGELRRLSSHASGVVRAATWFPNGEQLCYGHDRSLRIVNVTTGRTRSFASPLAGRAIGQSAVSPDGRRVAFALERDGVWLLDVETGRMRRVVEDAGATDDVSWAGRGGRLLYYSLSGRGEGAWRAAVTTVAGGAPISGSGVVSRDPGRK